MSKKVKQRKWTLFESYGFSSISLRTCYRTPITLQERKFHLKERESTSLLNKQWPNSYAKYWNKIWSKLFPGNFYRNHDTFMNFKYPCSLWSKYLCCSNRSLADKSEACCTCKKLKQIEEGVLVLFFACNLNISMLKWLNSNI